MTITMKRSFVALLLHVPLLTLASEETGERKTSTLSVGQCLTIVDKVQEGGKYSEESIASTCSEEAQSQKCEFFAEALSLASGHTDFEAKHFCSDITEAHFCSETMDHLLASEAVSDLAYGACKRARPAKGDLYCHKFQLMLGSAVNSTDLDTMRACYMMEAYAEGKEGSEENQKGDEKPAATLAEKPSSATIASQADEKPTGLAEKAADEKPTGLAEKPSSAAIISQADAHAAKASSAVIISQSQPLDHFGVGKGQAVQRGGLGPPTTILTRAVPVEQVTNLVVKAAVPVRAAAAASPPIIPVRTAGKETPAPASISKVQSGGVADALASKAVLVVPLEKLPEIAAAISTQVAESPAKKPQQVLLASSGNLAGNVPAQKHVQAQDSNATSSKPTTAPNSADSAKLPAAAAPARVEAAAPTAPKAGSANASRGEGQGKLSAAGSSVVKNGTVMSARTNQSTLAGATNAEKSALPSKLNGTTVNARNRSMPSLINLTADKRAGIVKTVIPLKPLRGKLDLRGSAKAADKRGAGLVTKTVAARMVAAADTAKGATKHAGEAAKDKKKDGYDGFLSKFIA